MRIGINGRYLKENKTGVGQYSANLIREWLKQPHQHELIIFTPFQKDQLHYIDADHLKNVTIVDAHAPTTGFRFLWWFTVTLPRLLKKNRIDFFCSLDYFLPPWLPCPGSMTLHDISYITHPEWFSWPYRIYCYLYSTVQIKKARLICTVSEYSKKEICKKFPTIDPSIIAVTPLGVDPVFNLVPDSQQWSDYQPYFLYVGKLLNRRHVDMLIRSFEIFQKEHKDKKFNLLIRGENETYPHIDFVQLIRESNAKLDRSAIHLLPRLSDTDLGQLYHQAFAFVYVSEYEGFGLPLLEAMNAGLPVITTATSSIPEVVGNAGIYVSINDRGTMIKAMNELSDDKKTYQSLQSKSKAQALLFSWQNTASSTLNYINKISHV